jgi:hypothetical protein
VLEHQGEDRTHVDAPALLEGDDVGAEGLPLALVGAEVGNVVEGEVVGVHHRTPTSA